LRVHDRARAELTQLEQLQPEEIERKCALDGGADSADGGSTTGFMSEAPANSDWTTAT